jgi:hypothetical protein
MANSTAITTKQKDFKNNLSLQNPNNKTGEELLASMWGLSPQRTQEVSNIGRMFFSKHGMFASVPIVCRAHECVYKDVCVVDPLQRVLGARCPMEIAALITRFNQWCNHFGINIEGESIESKDLVDATLIKDLVNIEIQILRCENKIALNGDFMADTLIDIDKKCNAYYGKVVTPESEFLMSLQDRKIKILNQLNATRKDKAVDKRKETASDEAVRIFQQMQELQREQNKAKYDIMDVDFDENGEILAENDDISTENDINVTENSENCEKITENDPRNNENLQKAVDEVQ